MDKALLFYNGEPILVSAKDVLEGKYPRDSEFVDVEYPVYKVRFICAGKPLRGEEIGIPYFRLYYSYEDYKRLYPDRADKYEIVADMRRFQESQWHKEWKEKLSPFCEIEKYFKFESRWKYADAFYTDANTCIELQHSYASFEFEDRNEFYAALKKKMIWLFHLPKAQVREAEDEMLEILEDNARGFFRAAYETQDKFNNVYVFIQTKSKKIYRVTELFRREGKIKEHIATVRFFKQTGVWTEEEWIKDLREGKLTDDDSNYQQLQKNDQVSYDEDIKSEIEQESVQTNIQPEGKYISELWKEDYKFLGLINLQDNNVIYIYRDKNKPGAIMRDYQWGCILYKYASNPQGKFYTMSRNNEWSKIWKFWKAKTINDEWVNWQLLNK